MSWHSCSKMGVSCLQQHALGRRCPHNSPHSEQSSTASHQRRERGHFIPFYSFIHVALITGSAEITDSQRRLRPVKHEPASGRRRRTGYSLVSRAGYSLITVFFSVRFLRFSASCCCLQAQTDWTVGSLSNWVELELRPRPPTTPPLVFAIQGAEDVCARWADLVENVTFHWLTGQQRQARCCMAPPIQRRNRGGACTVTTGRSLVTSLHDWSENVIVKAIGQSAEGWAG